MGVLAKPPCLGPNGNNGLSIGVPDSKLWRVLARMKMPFRDTWGICPRGPKRKPGNISKFCEHTHVCIGLEDLMDLLTNSQGGGSLV